MLRPAVHHGLALPVRHPHGAAQCVPAWLEAECLAAAAHLVSCGHYATLAAVTHAVCARHGALAIEHLGGCGSSVGALGWIGHVERTVAAHAACFVATHGIAFFFSLRHRLTSLPLIEPSNTQARKA